MDKAGGDTQVVLLQHAPRERILVICMRIRSYAVLWRGQPVCLLLLDAHEPIESNCIFRGLGWLSGSAGTAHAVFVPTANNRRIPNPSDAITAHIQLQTQNSDSSLSMRQLVTGQETP